jgi:hypothetical protein
MIIQTEHDSRITERIAFCRLEHRAYEHWLKTLTPANFLLAGIGGVLSLLAGLSIVTEASLIAPKTAGWIAVLGAVLTGLHNGLRCDPHQAECRRLANQFEGLQTEYERLQLEPDERARREQLLGLEQKLATVVSGRGARPSAASVARATRELKGSAAGGV